MRHGIFLLLLFAVAACGDTSPTASFYGLFSEDVRPLSAHEAEIYDSTAACMDLDKQSRPAIEYCAACLPNDPQVAGEYLTQIDRILIRPDFKGVDGLLAHESIHALLWRATGDVDPCHKGQFFRSCAPAGYISQCH